MSDPVRIAGPVAPQPASLGQARRFLTKVGLQAHDDDGVWTPLVGGVSSDLWRVELPTMTVCVKGALAQLRVADVWRAPLSRNAVEYAWLEFATRHRPGNLPRLYGHDEGAGFFVMEYLDPASHPNWKVQLLSGLVDPAFAGAVGDLVGALHAASTCDPEIPSRFATGANFAALRLDPYLRTTAGRTPAVAERLLQLADGTAATHLAVVHGDVSPKNVLAGSHGPILLDAECAWWGDPAFDVAFCLTHLALKMLVLPEHVADLAAAARVLLAAHAAHISWEAPDTHAARVAALLPALLLARVDGSSPVEYLDERQRAAVRNVAVTLLTAPAATPGDVIDRWRAGIR